MNYTMVVLVVFVSLYSKTNCRLEALPDELTSRLSLAKCVRRATDVFFQAGEIMLISLPIYEVNVSQASATVFDRLLFREMFSHSRLSIIIKKTTRSSKNENYQKSIDGYVIQVRRLPELQENLNILQEYSHWNPHARFIIVSVAFYENTTSAAAVITEQLWHKKIINGIVLLPNSQNSSIFEVFSWFPFTDGHCGNVFDKVKIIDRCSFGHFEIGSNWFSNKIPHNLNGCPINVRAVVWPPYVLPPSRQISDRDEYEFSDGLEILQMNTMSTMANFTVNYTMSKVVQDWGSIYRNGTATGTLLHLKNEEVDIAIGSFATSIETHMFFDSITYAIPESLTWCVPHAANMPQWQNLVIIISVDAWILLFICYICESLCLWGLASLKANESATYKSLSNCMQNCLSVTFNSPVRVQPRTTNARLLFLLWIFLCVHVNEVYQTLLISVFTKPKYGQQITSVNEIFDNKLKMWFLPTTSRYFINNDDWLSRKVLDNWRDCEDIAVCLQKTAFDKDSAMCTPRMYLKYIKNDYVTVNKQPLLYCFKDTIVTYPLEMLLRKGFPLKSYFSNLIGNIASSGLTAHWEKSIYDFELNNATSKLIIDDNDGMPKITIMHLRWMFILLTIGHSLGFMALLLELYLKSKCT